MIRDDGRNNDKDSKTRTLEEIGDHAKKTIWIIQEPKWGWTLGSCNLPLYEPSHNGSRWCARWTNSGFSLTKPYRFCPH